MTTINLGVCDRPSSNLPTIGSNSFVMFTSYGAKPFSGLQSCAPTISQSPNPPPLNIYDSWYWSRCTNSTRGTMGSCTVLCAKTSEAGCAQIAMARQVSIFFILSKLFHDKANVPKMKKR